MFMEQKEKNRMKVFKHLVEREKQNPETVFIDGKHYCYKTKRGLLKSFVSFDSFNEYRNSSFYENCRNPKRADGFILCR